MTIEQDVKKSELPAYVQLFDIDLTMIPGLPTSVYHYTPYTDGAGGKIVFGNTQYDPFPIQISGVEQNSDSAPPRPRLDISNVNKIVGSLVFQYHDLVGAKIVYTKTLASYLGTSQRISAPPLTLYISKKLAHDKVSISFELRSPLDKERAVLPGRQMLKRDFPGLGVNKQYG